MRTFGARVVKSALVVGAGLAGLGAALELARAGLAVDVFEAADRPGGRAQALVSPDGRFRFDMGPTIVTMTDVLRRALGDDAFARLGLRRLEPGYRVLWPDGGHLDMHSDIALWLDEIRRFTPDRAADALHYLARMQEHLAVSRARILETPCAPSDVARLLLRPGKLRPWALRGLRSTAERSFRHPRLVQAATFQTLYLGLTPSRAPAAYGLLMSSEVVDGIWYAPGGTAAIVAALVGECERHGVAFHYGAPVSQVIVNAGRAQGAVAAGRMRRADAVVVAADREPAARDLLGASGARRTVRYGHSALVYYFGLAAQPALPHHTVLLPDDPWRAYAMLDAGAVPDEPLIYLCNPAVNDPSATPGAVSALVPVPNRRVLAELDADAIAARVLERLRRHDPAFGNPVLFRAERGPKELERDLGLEAGAAFGPAHDLLQMGPLRPSIAYGGARNLAFAGSGTRPGSGVPMVLISGRLAAAHVLGAA